MKRNYKTRAQPLDCSPPPPPPPPLGPGPRRPPDRSDAGLSSRLHPTLDASLASRTSTLSRASAKGSKRTTSSLIPISDFSSHFPGANMTDEQYQLELRRRARSKMVYIDASVPNPKEEGRRLHCRLTGTIVCAEEDFLYVVVPRGVLPSLASLHVVLPDGCQTDIASDGFSKLQVPGGGRLSGFYIRRRDGVNYDIEQISAAEFGGDVTLFQEVYLCDFVDGNFNMTGGQVISMDDVLFTHSCAPTKNTGNGGPVLDVDCRFVGVSVHMMQGPTNALPRITLEKEANKIFDSKDLQHFIRLIYMGG